MFWGVVACSLVKARLNLGHGSPSPLSVGVCVCAKSEKFLSKL